MRRAAKVDRNQTEIVKAFRDAGATVLFLHAIGSGAPDICVGWRGQNFLIEIKDGKLYPSKRRLTVQEQAFHDTWAGQVCVATSIEDAVEKVIHAGTEAREEAT